LIFYGRSSLKSLIYFFTLIILTGCSLGPGNSGTSKSGPAGGVLIDNFNDRDLYAEFPWGGWNLAMAGANTGSFSFIANGGGYAMEYTYTKAGSYNSFFLRSNIYNLNELHFIGVRFKIKADHAIPVGLFSTRPWP
jgi:hypothetical protein